jgi:hypothetical protein
MTPHARDWTAHPAIVEIAEANEVYAVSDPHGEYPIFAGILAANRLIDAAPAAPSEARWTGGSAILVVVGDMIDKGPESLEVIDLVRQLSTQAPLAGGRVVATMGNHEAEFLRDPRNSKATSTGEDSDGIDNELAALHVAPESVAQGTDAAGRGEWIANLPLGVRIRDWFFSHAGNSYRLTVRDLAQRIEHAVEQDGYGGLDITGPSSILEAQGWYGDVSDPNAGRAEADALGVHHIAFGHDPKAFGERDRIRASANRILVKLDTAMGIHHASGIGAPSVLHIEGDTVEVLDGAGRATPLP